MRCSEIMKQQVAWCGVDDAITMVASKMRDANVGFVPVCDELGHVVGTITDRDLTMRVIAEGRSVEATRAHDVMSTGIVACRPEDDLGVAERLMSDHKVSRVICTDIDGRIEGVVSLSDLADHADPAHAARVLRSVSHREARVELR